MKPSIFKISRFFFLFVGLFCYSVGFSQNTCYLRINLNDCMNCIGQVKQIKSIDESLSPIIILEKKHEGYGKKFLEHRLDLNMEELTILFSDEWYNELSKGTTSTVHVVNQEKIVLFEGALKKLSEHLPTINSFAGTGVSGLSIENNIVPKKQPKSSNISKNVLAQLPESVLLSSEYYLIPFFNGYYLHDYMFNQLYLFPKDGEMKTVSAKSIDKEALHQKTFGHLKHHRATIFYDEILTQLNQKDVIIESAAVDGETLYAIAKLPYPVVETTNGEHALIIKAKYIMLAFEEMALTEIYPIDMLENSDYNVDPVSFRVEDGQFVLSLFKNKFQDKNYFSANFSKTETGLVFDNFIKAEVPSFFKEKNLVYEYFYSNTTENYVFFEYGNNYVDLKKNKELTLPKTIVDISNLNDFKDFKILASHANGQDISIVFLKNNKYYSSVLNAKSNEVKALHTLKLPQNITDSPSNWVFKDSGEVLIVNNNNQIVWIPLEGSNSLSLQNEDGNSKTKTERHP